MASNWDQSLTKLALQNVRIHASSLTEAWKAASTKYLVRSVLVASDRAFEALPFAYESVICTVKQLYDAVAATYGLHWVQDEDTGVAWFHPTGPMSPVTASHSRLLHRKCACGGAPAPTGNCETCRKKRLQRKTLASELGTRNDSFASPIVHEVLRSPGEPLDLGTRAFMEPRFGHDFNQVRLHTDVCAAEFCADHGHVGVTKLIKERRFKI
jgi:hypothetical protein